MDSIKEVLSKAKTTTIKQSKKQEVKKPNSSTPSIVDKVSREYRSSSTKFGNTNFWKQRAKQ
jgi:hypothetical protein